MHKYYSRRYINTIHVSWIERRVRSSWRVTVPGLTAKVRSESVAVCVEKTLFCPGA